MIIKTVLSQFVWSTLLLLDYAVSRLSESFSPATALENQRAVNVSCDDNFIQYIASVIKS
jgi:hypothetical protein